MAEIVCLAMLMLLHVAQGYPYPAYTDKRYNRASYRPAYIPMPLPYSMPQDTAQQDAPYYYYYPYRTDSRLAYMDDPMSQMNIGETADETGYPFGQEMWFEGGADGGMSAAANAAATREAILQNLIIAQMYEDAAANAAVSGFPFYQMPSEDYENKDWKYGVPTTGVEEKERARQFLKHEEDEEVKELENLRKAKEANKDAKRRRKQKAKEAKEAEAKEAKQVQEMRAAIGLTKREEPVMATRRPLLTEPSLANAASVSGRNTLGGGQKEVVLPQPARPARRPFSETAQKLHIRSEQPSVYQTIKQLLAMESDYRKTDNSRLQKRFISTEEQLTEQLRGLKKSAL